MKKVIFASAILLAVACNSGTSTETTTDTSMNNADNGTMNSQPGGNADTSGGANLDTSGGATGGGTGSGTAQVPEQVRVVVEQGQAVVVQAQVPDRVLAALAVVPVEAEQVQVDLEQVAEPEQVLEVEQVLVREVVDQPGQVADFKR
jgi:hypothetical protein